MKKLTYNPVVFKIEGVDDVPQCQFVYRTGERCNKDAFYRIGETIYLCGYHTPGVGRCFRNRIPIYINSIEPIV